MTTTTTTPNGRSKTGPGVYHDMRELIQALMDHPMSPKQMIELQNQHETDFVWKQTCFENMLQYIGSLAPVYEYTYRRYKVLTQKDIDLYREELKNGKQRNDLA